MSRNWLDYLLKDFNQDLALAKHADELKRLRVEVLAASGTPELRMQALERHATFLEGENAALKLHVAGLLRLLVAKQLVTAAELREAVQQVDAEDGQHDGRYHLPILPPREITRSSPPGAVDTP
jgi:hypothetical protein